MFIAELERALQEAVTRRKEMKAGGLEAFVSAEDAVIHAERALAAAKGEQYAVPVEFPVSWDIGVPLPCLLQDERHTYLIFFLRETEPRSDRVSVKVGNVEVQVAGEIADLAVVEFEGCSCTKMGAPNDEVLGGHPLYGKGLVHYRAQAVENSAWLKELDAINAVHWNYQPKFKRELKHYVFPFHDSTFECVARSFKVETFTASFRDILTEVCRRLAE